MKAEVGVLIIIVCAVLVWAIIRLFQSALEARQTGHAKWHPVPRTDEANNARTIWLLCKGEKDFLFWPTDGNTRWDFDRAMMEAEICAQDLNRQKKELTA